LHTGNASPKTLKALPLVLDRLAAVKKFRSNSKRAVTKRLSDYPTSYGVTTVPKAPFLAMPQVSSERRDYAPIGWLDAPTIPSEKLRVLLDTPPTVFAVLTSAMHMAWMRTVTGRMKSDYMYSVGVVYNTFPMPPVKDLKKLEPHAQAILDARAKFPDATLAELYDPDIMPAALRKAHIANDKAVDKLYRKSGFKSERERVEHLFMLYEKMTAGMLVAEKKPKKPKTKPKSAKP
jgi:hypothetical protein